jgi:DamX protein
MKHKLYVVLFIVNLLICRNVLAVMETSTSKAGITSNRELTFNQIKMSAENGDAEAQYALGYMYFYGKGGAPKDSGLAKSWISKAAAQKQPQAIRALALINAKSPNAPSKDYPHSTNTSQATNEGEAQETKPVLATRKTELTDEKAMTLGEMRNRKTMAGGIYSQQPSFASNRRMLDEHASFSSTPKRMESKLEGDSENLSTKIESSDNLYTLQLLAASNKDQIIKLINDHHLGKRAKIYQHSLNGKDWFVLIYGEYKTKSEAKLVGNKLEEELTLKPWVKPYASIKQAKLVFTSK